MPQLRVPARSEQREILARLVRRDKIRIRIGIREAQKRRQNVRFEMIDGDGRQPPTASERVGQRAAREQGGGEPRPGRVSDGGGDFARPRQAIRIAQHRIDHRQQAAQMIARSDFRHHAAEARMACGLRKHARIRDSTVGENQRASGFVAGGLDPQNRQGGGHFFNYSAAQNHPRKRKRFDTMNALQPVLWQRPVSFGFRGTRRCRFGSITTKRRRTCRTK